MAGSDLVTQAWQFLGALPFGSLVAIFWLVLLIEMPRYFVGIQATAAALLLSDWRRPAPLTRTPRISILLVGHNEETTLEKCVWSLRSQTYQNFEIVCVDDGSSDATFSIMTRLQREGLVQSVARLDLRGGKASGINLAARMARSEFFVVVDCDCSFEPDAIEELVRPLMTDPSIAAVSGNILVRNWRVSLTASMQAIEYLVSISLGKAYSNVLDQVSCVSGAFGAFRRRAWEQIGGMDVESRLHDAPASRWLQGSLRAPLDLLHRCAGYGLCLAAATQSLGARRILDPVPEVSTGDESVQPRLFVARRRASVGLHPVQHGADACVSLLRHLALHEFRRFRADRPRRGGDRAVCGRPPGVRLRGSRHGQAGLLAALAVPAAVRPVPILSDAFQSNLRLCHRVDLVAVADRQLRSAKGPRLGRLEKMSGCR